MRKECDNCGVIFDFTKKDVKKYNDEDQVYVKISEWKKEYKTINHMFGSIEKELVKSIPIHRYDVFITKNIGIKCPMCNENHFIKETDRKYKKTIERTGAGLNWV